MNIVFFGSFQHYSDYILESLINHPDLTVTGVVTTPPMPVGRKHIITKTPVHLLAEQHDIPVFTPEKLEASMLSNDARSRTPPTRQGVEDVDLRHALPKILKPDLFLTAGYGKILPDSWLAYPKFGALNLHFSLLPAYRGANPAEWAIMGGETKTGITLIQMSSRLDGGDILNQAEISIEADDTREALYEKLYRLGAAKLPDWLINSPLAHPQPQGEGGTPYAALLKRDDGFLPWTTIKKALRGQTLQSTDFPSKKLQTALTYLLNKSENNQVFQRAAGPRRGGRESSTAKTSIVESFLTRLPRALAGYPSLWTIVSTVKGDKRMKIISFNPLWVQLEGQQPSLFNQIKNQLV